MGRADSILYKVVYEALTKDRVEEGCRVFVDRAEGPFPTVCTEESQRPG